MVCAAIRPAFHSDKAEITGHKVRTRQSVARKQHGSKFTSNDLSVPYTVYRMQDLYRHTMWILVFCSSGLHSKTGIDA